MERRGFIKSGVMAALGLLLFKPLTLLAAWPKSLFDHQGYSAALDDVLQGDTLQESEQVNLKIPPISQSGVSVPASVTTTLEQVESITLLVENNPNPMVAMYYFSGSAMAYVSTRIKMNKSSPVHVIVKVDGRYYGTSQMVTVKKSGCYESGS